MAWTYRDPSSNDKDAVRFRIGDTDRDDKQLQDEEITYLLGLFTNVVQASAEAARAIAAKYAREASRTVGPVSIQANVKFEHYRDLADIISKGDVGVNTPIPWAGGLFKFDRQRLADDDALLHHVFTKRTLEPPESDNA